MRFKEYLKSQAVPMFFVSFCFITLAMAVLGSLFEPDAQLGYGVLFSPFVYSIAAALIDLMFYTKKEPSPRGALLRNIINVLLLEAGMLAILYFAGALTSPGLSLALALAILAIYFAVKLLLWLNDRRYSKALNQALWELQKRQGREEGE